MLHKYYKQQKNIAQWFNNVGSIPNLHDFSSLCSSCSAEAPLSQLKMYSFMGGGLFCAIVGNILLVVSTATDYWMQYRLSGNYAHQGLWRYCMSNKCYMQTDSIGKTPRAPFEPRERAETGKNRYCVFRCYCRSCGWIDVGHEQHLKALPTASLCTWAPANSTDIPPIVEISHVKFAHVKK